MTDACIIGEGTLTRDRGYRVRNVGGNVLYVHRMAWEAAFGSIPSGYQIHHECGNRECVNLEHLRLVSASEHARIHNRSVKVCPKCGSTERVPIRTRPPKTYCGPCKRQRDREWRQRRVMA